MKRAANAILSLAQQAVNLLPNPGTLPTPDRREIIAAHLQTQLQQYCEGNRPIPQVSIDLEHAEPRLVHSTVSTILEINDTPYACLAPLCGCDAIVTDGRQAYWLSNNRERAIKKVDPENRPSNSRWIRCTHYDLPGQLQDGLDIAHRSATNATSYVDGFFNLWTYGSGSLLIRAMAAAKRDMAPYLLFSQALGYTLALATELGTAPRTAQEIIDLLQGEESKRTGIFILIGHPKAMQRIEEHFAAIHGGDVVTPDPQGRPYVWCDGQQFPTPA